MFEPLLLGEDGGHLNAAEANLDTDEEDLEGREQKGHCAEGWRAMSGKSLEKAKCAEWRPTMGDKPGKVSGGQTVDNLKGI